MMTRPNIKAPKKDDPITAKLQQDIIRGLNSDLRDAPDTPQDQSPYQGYAFQPFFYLKDDGSYYVVVKPSWIGNNQADIGTHEWKVPEFQGDPIVNPDETDLTWTPPEQSMSADDWEMFLVVGVASDSNSSADIIVQTAGTADPTPKPPWKNVYKLATWTISSASGSLYETDVQILGGRGLNDNVNHYLPFEPILWHDGSDFKAKFTPAHVQPYDGTIIDVTVQGGAMATNTGVTVTTADEWWLEITTDGDGVPTAADLDKQTSPSNIVPDGVVTTGKFYYKVCTFSLDSDFFIPELHWSGNVLWQWEYEAPAGGFDHPWKVTDRGTGSVVDIAAGYVYGYYMDPAAGEGGWGTNASGPTADYQPSSIVLAPAYKYNGGNSATSSGDNYFYAIIDRNGPTDAYAESITDGVDTNGDNLNINVELGDDIEPPAWASGAPGTNATITSSSSPPDTYTPATGKAAVCIAKVNNDGANNLTITQYATHNPTVFVPVVKVIAG